MKKEEIRKEFFKLRIKHHSYNQCRKILKAKYDYGAAKRTLQRWTKRLNETEWDLKDKSTRPKTIYQRITPRIEEKIINLRKKTGWGEHKIVNFIPKISHASVYKILNKHKLTIPNSRRKKRIKYIRFQRKHPNSMWQADTADQKVKNKYVLSVIDDCSRYSLAMTALKRLSTTIVTHVLDKIINNYGKPREILTDNGNVFGLRSKHSKFDRWCRRRNIKHIRTAVHSPTTTGKVERLFQTLMREMPYCNNDPELFRMRYNHFRPHTSLYGRTLAEIYFRG